MRFCGSLNCFQSVALRIEFHSRFFEGEEVSGSVALKLEVKDEVIELCSDLSLSFSPLSVSFWGPEDHGGHRMTVYIPSAWNDEVFVGLSSGKETCVVSERLWGVHN